MSPKQRVVAEIQRSRRELLGQLQDIRAQLNPQTLLRDSLQRNPGLWAALGGLLGLTAARLLRPRRVRKFDRDKDRASDRKTGLLSLLMEPALSALRQEALRAGAAFLAQWAANRGRHAERQGTETQAPPKSDP